MRPFAPRAASTVNIDVSSSSQVVSLGVPSAESIRVMNNGTVTAWVEFGDSTVAASLTTSFPVGPGVTEVLRGKTVDRSNLYAAAIAAGATGKIYFTTGDGL